MDDADRADIEIERSLQQALSKHRPTLLYTGSCWWCDTVLDAGVFCNAECRDDYEHEQAGRARAGR